MRVANLQMSNGVEVSVIPLPVPPGNDREYLLSNVNRWREQLRLGRLNSSELAQQSYKLKTADGDDVTVADFRGWLNESALPPMARGAMATTNESPPAQDGPNASQGPFSYEVPEGWDEQTAGGMRTVAFAIQDGDETAEVTAIALGEAAGGVFPNVNRWRGQVGLPELANETELDVENIEIDGQAASYVRLDGPSSQSILAAIHSRAGRAWFFKFTGSTAIAASQQEPFRQFLGSIKFR
jgi:hypothetical protein